jgi:hypothetical protein
VGGGDVVLSEVVEGTRKGDPFLWVGIEGRKRVGPKKNSATLIYSIFSKKA